MWPRPGPLCQIFGGRISSFVMPLPTCCTLHSTFYDTNGIALLLQGDFWSNINMRYWRFISNNPNHVSTHKQIPRNLNEWSNSPFMCTYKVPFLAYWNWHWWWWWYCIHYTHTIGCKRQKMHGCKASPDRPVVQRHFELASQISHHHCLGTH